MKQQSTIHDQLLYQSCSATLTAIQRKHYPEQGRFKQLYSEVTECLRTYLNKQYELDIGDRSLAELERVLKGLRGPTELFRDLRLLFEENDKVQAASWLPAKEEALRQPERAQALLRKLAPAAAQNKGVEPPVGEQEHLNHPESSWTFSAASTQQKAA